MKVRIRHKKGRYGMLEVGIKGLEKEMVTEKNTAASMGSGLLPVYATPSMIALMEYTASQSVQSMLGEGEGTVGTAIDIQHSAATPMGMEITCESELIEIDRKRLVFKVTARDSHGEIGSGIHQRFIINNEKFMAKAEGKKA